MKICTTKHSIIQEDELKFVIYKESYLFNIKFLVGYIATTDSYADALAVVEDRRETGAFKKKVVFRQ